MSDLKDSNKVQEKPEGRTPSRPSPGISDFMAGEAKDFKVNLKPYLPQDLVGGSLPHIYGTEDEAVWNAASQACGTEKVHYVYTVEGDRVWYLACSSASLASNPDSWCPIAAALPGNSEYWDRETVYLYEQEGVSSALRWDPETGRMQVFLGASRTILPRVQSMDANFVTINPDMADVIVWKNQRLKTEKLTRSFIRTLLYLGLLVNLIAAAVLIMSIISVSAVNYNLEDIKKKTDDTALELVESATNVMQSDTIKHMVRVQQLLDNLALSNAYLVRYEVSKKGVEWNAIAPQGLSSTVIKSTKTVEMTGGRPRSYVPTVLGPEAGDNVRIEGKR